jgi:hypothetical protein
MSPLRFSRLKSKDCRSRFLRNVGTIYETAHCHIHEEHDIVKTPITCRYHTEYSPVFIPIEIYTVCNTRMFWTANNYWYFWIGASHNVSGLIYRTDTNQNSILALNVSVQPRNHIVKFSFSSFLGKCDKFFSLNDAAWDQCKRWTSPGRLAYTSMFAES